MSPRQLSATRRTPKGLRLRDAVVLSLIILLVASFGIASLVWHWQSKQSVENGARAVQSEIGARIEDHIRRFLAVPHEINRANAAALHVVGLAAVGPSELEKLFLEQVKIFESVSSIYAGSPTGGLIDAGREGAGGLLYVIETEGFQSGSFQKFSVDASGERLDLLLSLPSFDARTRPWYQAALLAGEATWSDIYVLFSGQDMAIAASHPVYDEEGTLLLVLSTDIFLSQIDEFMRTLEYGNEGLGFIVDRTGHLVASSTREPQLDWDETTGAFERIHSQDSDAPLIRHSSRYIQDVLGGFGELTHDHQGEFSISGERQFIQIHQIVDAYGIEWLSVIVVPERDFMGNIISSTRTTLLLLAVALMLIVGAGIGIVRWVTKPMETLTSAAHSMGEGQLATIPNTSRIRELQDLSTSFEEMRRKLTSSMGSLQQEIAERQDAVRTLRESERQLLTYIERAPIAIFVANANAELIDANPAACEMTGYSREELLRIGIPGLSHHVEGKAEMPLFESLLMNGVVSGESQLTRKDGSEVWFQIDGVALEPNRLVSFCTDITQRKQTEESLRHQQRMESLGIMAGGVAHEINNPLMGMMSYAELIEGRIENQDAKDFARSILSEGERIAHIVRNLLSFAREDRGARQPTDLRSIVRDALPLINTALLRSQITIHTELDTPVPDIHCSRPQIQQVLVNLLMNARDALDLKYPGFDPSKTIAIRIVPHQKHDETWVRAIIHDRGVGMSANLTSLAFDPFFTTKSRDERTGLGLTVSFGIVREHGGSIEIDSVEGEGTSVIIDFPPA